MNIVKGIALGLLDCLAIVALSVFYGTMLFFALLASFGWK